MKTTQCYLWIIALVLTESIAAGQTPTTSVAQKHPTDIKIEGRYSGAWITTKYKKLDGTTHSEVKQLSKDRWQGRFWGVWQRVPFDYTVEFGPAKLDLPLAAQERSGQMVSLIGSPAANLVAGKATIDGAHYDWVGTLTPEEFRIRFTGSRYEGHLELKKVHDRKPPVPAGT